MPRRSNRRFALGSKATLGRSPGDVSRSWQLCCSRAREHRRVRQNRSRPRVMRLLHEQSFLKQFPKGLLSYLRFVQNLDSEVGKGFEASKPAAIEISIPLLTRNYRDNRAQMARSQAP